MRKIIKVLDGAAVGSVTANPIDILGAKRVTLVCNRASHSSGSSTFSAEVGVKGALATYNRWITNVTNTNAQQIIRDDDLALSSDTSNFISMSPEDVFETITVKVVTGTDGVSNAWLILDYEDDIK